MLKLRYDFEADIIRFNEMYNMPCNRVPTMLFPTAEELTARLIQFRKIMEDEVAEVDELIEEHIEKGAHPLDVLAHLADWLGDMQVFCASEMRKFGLHNETVLGIIMSSNFSKLQADGTALFVDGKLQKGPNYWKPEPQLKRYIQAAVRVAAKDAEEAGSKLQQKGAEE